MIFVQYMGSNLDFIFHSSEEVTKEADWNIEVGISIQSIASSKSSPLGTVLVL